MPLILAIEPDRRQAAHLTSLVRHRVGAELILAETTEGALGAIGNRVPDLVLVPALLSPQDDTALAQALRVIATAAHVQMLTTPVLAASSPKEKSRGMLSSLLRRGSSAPTEGCDPAVFAEQICSYLQRGEEERELMELQASSADRRDREPVEAAAPVAPEPLFVKPEAVEIVETFVQAEDQPFSFQQAEDQPFSFQAEAPTYSEPPVVMPVAETEVQAPTFEPPAFEPFVPETMVPEPVVFEPPVFEPVFEPPAFATPSNEPTSFETAVFNAPVLDQPEVEESPALQPLYEPEPERTSIFADAMLAPPAEAPAVTEPTRFSEAMPAFDDILARLERETLPVIEEVRAEPWMEQPTVEDEPASEEVHDVDLTAELELEDTLRVIQAVDVRAEHIEASQPRQSAAFVGPEPTDDTPFVPLVSAPAPREHVDPLVISPWQIWPQLEGEPVESAPVEIFAADMLADTNAIDQDSEAMSETELVVTSIPHAAPEIDVPTARSPLAAQAESAARGASARHQDWVELIESLREDIGRLKTEGMRPAVAAGVSLLDRPIAPKPIETPAPPASDKPKPRPVKRPTPAPIQNEWGFFDPEQCGFAALIAKLDEITENEDPPRRG
jgi:hypothetical protein